jgi:hypothetical protein
MHRWGAHNGAYLLKGSALAPTKLAVTHTVVKSGRRQHRA